MKDVLTTCVYCGCGCGLYLHEDEGRVTGAMASQNHPVSRGNLCVKGWNVHEFIHHPARLSEPLIRKNGQLTPASWDEAIALTARRLTEPLIRKNGRLTPASWDEAIAFTAERLAAIGERTGHQGLGVLASAKCTNEENFLLQKFTRAVLKTNNIDHCARL